MLQRRVLPRLLYRAVIKRPGYIEDDPCRRVIIRIYHTSIIIANEDFERGVNYRLQERGEQVSEICRCHSGGLHCSREGNLSQLSTELTGESTSLSVDTLTPQYNMHAMFYRLSFTVDLSPLSSKPRRFRRSGGFCTSSPDLY